MCAASPVWRGRATRHENPMPKLPTAELGASHVALPQPHPTLPTPLSGPPTCLARTCRVLPAPPLGRIPEPRRSHSHAVASWTAGHRRRPSRKMKNGVHVGLLLIAAELRAGRDPSVIESGEARGGAATEDAAETPRAPEGTMNVGRPAAPSRSFSTPYEGSNPRASRPGSHQRPPSCCPSSRRSSPRECSRVSRRHHRSPSRPPRSTTGARGRGRR